MTAIMLTTALLSGAMTCSLSGAPGHPAMTIPPGTAIRVRTVDPIDIRSIHPGAEFGIAGGGAGAVVGALVGGGGGTAVAAATGSHDLSIPPETSFSFVLQSAVRLK